MESGVWIRQAKSRSHVCFLGRLISWYKGCSQKRLFWNISAVKARGVRLWRRLPSSALGLHAALKKLLLVIWQQSIVIHCEGIRLPSVQCPSPPRSSYFLGSGHEDTSAQWWFWLPSPRGRDWFTGKNLAFSCVHLLPNVDGLRTFRE